MLPSVFSINSVYTDLSLKKITIETNFQVDKETVNTKTVRFINTETGEVQSYNLSVEDKNIIINLHEYPIRDLKYMLFVSNIKNVIGEIINVSFHKEIIFEADIKKKISISKPINKETLKTKNIEIEIQAVSEEDEETKYRFNIASDAAFSNIIKDVVSNTDKIIISVDTDNQYFLRARPETDTLFGDWTEAISFNVFTKECNGNYTEDDKEFLDDFVFTDDIFTDNLTPAKIIERTENGETEYEYYIELDKKISFKSILNLEKKPEFLYLQDIVAYRRDF